MSRVQTPRDLSNRVAVRPGASDVSRYATPVQPTVRVGPSTAEQIAEAFAEFNPKLMNFSQREQARDDEEAKQQAIRDRSKNAVVFGEAVKQGIIPPDANPFYVKQWKTLDGSVMADEYNKDLLIALSSGPLANSTDQNESKALLDMFRQNWQEENIQDFDPDFIQGFDRKARAYETQVRNHQAARVGDNIVVAAGEAFSSSVQGILDEINTRDLSLSEVAEAINIEKEKALFVGMKPQDTNALILKAIANEAKSRLDLSVFDILGSIKTGSGTLGGTAAAKDLKLQVTNQIYSELRQRDEYEYVREQRRQNEIVRTANIAIGGRLLQDQSKGLPTTIESVRTELDAIIAVGDVNHAQSLVSAIIKSQKEPDRPENELVKNRLYIDTLAGREVNFARLTRHFESQDINLATYDDLMHEQLSIQKDLEADEDARNKDTLDENFRESLASLGRIAGGDLALNDFALQVSRSQAEAQFRRGAREWLKANPNAGPIEKIEASTKLLNTIVEQFRSKFGRFAGSVDEIIQSAPGVQSGQIKAIGLQPPKTYFKDAADWEQAIDEETASPGNSRIANLARSLGMTIEQFIIQQNPLY